MLLDPSATSVQTNVRTDRPVSSYAETEGTRKAEGDRSESGRTSQSSPDVVSRISAATLEASRALTQAGQAADQNEPEESVRESERREPPRQQEQVARTDQRSRGVDLLV